MKKVNRLVLLGAALACVLMGSQALAAVPYNNVKILEFAVGGPYGTDAVLRLSEHENVDKPVCATSGAWTLRIDGSDEAGKLAISAAMLAQATGANVDFFGEDTCIGTINKLRWIRLDN